MSALKIYRSISLSGHRVVLAMLWEERHAPVLPDISTNVETGRVVLKGLN